MGTIRAICISEKRGTEKHEIPTGELIADHGLKGDAHAGNWHRQVNLLPYEAAEAFKARGADIVAGSFGENLLVEGWDLKSLPVGTRFAIGDALLEMTQIGKECHSHCTIYQSMGECIMPHEGVFAVVLRGGEIRVGDGIRMIPAKLYSTVRDRKKDADAVLATVAEGKHAGEKLLVMDGIVRWQRPGSLFLRLHLDEIGRCVRTELAEIAGEKVFIERLGSKPHLIVCGGGHVSAALVRLAKGLGFEITVIEDRPAFAENAGKAGADRVLCGEYAEKLAEIPAGTDQYFAVLTRGHRFDGDCLRTILKRPYAYAGMMGSRRRGELVRRQLLDEGFPEEAVASVHTPIGLPIGAETPEEIAVSIAAELIRVKSERGNGGFPDSDIISVLCDPDDGRQKMLATIVSKRGSAPREVGTKMLVCDDGRCYGTIGGGAAEGKVIAMCADRMRTGSPEGQTLIKEVMTAENAAEDGLVCGGTVEILIERV